VILPCHTTDSRGGGRGGGCGLNWMEQGKFQNSSCLAPLWAAIVGDPRTLFDTAGRVGVCWPIYTANLLVSAVLIQPIPIIIGDDYIKTVDTKNTDLWCQPH
jgi:hypothetical protein